MPSEIYASIESKNLVIFAGAGISTENKAVLPLTFYQETKDDLELPLNSDHSFSEIMSKYEETMGKKALVQKIKQRFDYIDSFPELYRNATRFHKELSTLFFIKEIITTNWDDYFERECGAIPFVSDSDFAFWDLPDRKVFKLHGSINNYGSIVATKSEYNKKYRHLRDGLIGANLKLSLATKTMVFVGYSFQDEDFNKIYETLSKLIGKVMPKIFIVSPNTKEKEKLKKFNAVGIDTDATYFLSKIREHYTDEKFLTNDDNYHVIKYNLEKIQIEHAKLGKGKYNFKKNPESIYLASYQDGITHAFERILVKRKTGEYSHLPHLAHLIHSYVAGIKKHKRENSYTDVAYCEGYIVGLMCMQFGTQMIGHFPMYYLHGYKKRIFTESEYLRLRKKAQKMHKSSYKFAVQWVNKITAPDTVYHHPPYF